MSSVNDRLEREYEEDLLQTAGLPPVETVVEADNPYNPAIKLKARIVRSIGEAYHSRSELSHSQFCKFMEDPQVFRDKYINQDPELSDESAAFKFGKEAEHFLFFEELLGNPLIVPREVLSKRKKKADWYEAEAVEYDENNPEHHTYAKSGAKYKAWLEENDLEGTRTILTQDQYDAARAPLEILRRSVREHEMAKTLLYGPTIRHLAIVFTCPYSGIELRCQLDLLQVSARIIIDYKTAMNNDLWTFAKSFYGFRYHIQASWYREAIRQLTGDLWPVSYVVSEKSTKSFIVETFEVEPDWFTIGHFEWSRELIRFEKCLETQKWFRETHGKIIPLPVPKYLWDRFPQLRP